MKLLFAIVLITLLTQSNGFRFGTLYNDHGQYTGRNLDISLQPPKYSYDNPFASASNFDYRRRYFTQSPEGNAQTLRYTNLQNSNGDYKYEYETENKIRAEQSGQNINGENVVQGSYSYVGPDGVTYTVNYIADKLGYRAYGAHLPTQPDEVAPIVNRRYYNPVERDFFGSPSYRTPYVQQNNRYNPFIPSKNVVVYDSPERFLTPPYQVYNSFASSTPAAVQPLVYTTTARPFISSTTPGSFF